MEHNVEQCKNPWENACNNEQIKLYIQFNGEIIPICECCWKKIADQNIEW
ncbi:MAG: hypothetical protein FWH37_06310 [Candidatus Bathyarchaeota archaeon]|nr:hypothetical protein [Candidatus Termiticorpusculum sp.]